MSCFKIKLDKSLKGKKFNNKNFSLYNKHKEKVKQFDSDRDDIPHLKDQLQITKNELDKIESDDQYSLNITKKRAELKSHPKIIQAIQLQANSHCSTQDDSDPVQTSCSSQIQRRI